MPLDMPPGGAPPVAPKPPGAGVGGPGASPMLSPGGGLGAQASAVEKIKKLHTAVVETINAFPTGSKEQQALLRVAQTLSLFSKEQPGGPPGGVNPAVAAMNAPGGAPPPPMGGGAMPPGGPPMPPGGGGPPEIGAAA